MTIDVPTGFLENAIDSLHSCRQRFRLYLRQVSHPHVGLITLSYTLEEFSFSEYLAPGANPVVPSSDERCPGITLLDSGRAYALPDSSPGEGPRCKPPHVSQPWKRDGWSRSVCFTVEASNWRCP